MKLLRKVIAITSIATIVLASTITNAANVAINDTTATTPANVGTTTTVITITDTITGTGFSDTNEIVSAEITNLDGTTTVGSTTLTALGTTGNDATSELEIATADLTDNAMYVISFTTATGDYGVSTLTIGTPTNDRIIVTATVQPVLKFAMANINNAFGTLSTTTGSITTDIEVGTNAIGGLNITAESTNGGLVSATAGHQINESTNDALYDAEGYFFSSTVASTTPDSMSGAVITGLNTSTNVDELNKIQTIYTALKPQNFDTTEYDVTFTVEAKVAESTPSASDYTDVIIFTTTANF